MIPTNNGNDNIGRSITGDNNNTHTGLRLKVQFRRISNDVDGRHNQFVRLTPNTAKQLRDLAVESSYHTTSGQRQEQNETIQSWTNVQQQQHRRQQEQRWYIYNEEQQSNRCDSGIEFLPLAITVLNTKNVDNDNNCVTKCNATFYVSYNGGNIDPFDTTKQRENNNDNLDSYIDIPRNVLQNVVNLDDYRSDDDDHETDIELLVQPLVYIDSISELYVEPVTFEDWDVLQLYPLSSLEDGTFLQQISVIYSQQIFELSLSADVKVRLRVLPCNFDDGHNTTERSSIWPQTGNKSHHQQETRHPCFRLLADTQIIITSKERRSVIDYPLQLIPTLQDYCIIDPFMIPIAKELCVELLDVEQGSLLIHPTTLSHIRSITGTTTNCNQNQGDLAVIASSLNVNDNLSITVRLVESIHISEDHAALHPLSRIQLDAPIFSSRSARIYLKKFLSLIEIVKSSSIIPELVRTGEVNVILRPIRLITQSKTNSWCIPNVARVDSANNRTNTEITNLMQRFRTKYDFPIPIGSIISLSSCNDCLYRIDLEAHHDVIGRIKDSFIQSNHLPELCRFDDSKEYNVPAEVVLFEKPHSSRCILGLLPEYSVCIPSTIELAETALRRSCALVYGDQGSGKTFTSLMIAAVARVSSGDRCVYLDCRKLRDTWTVRMKTILAEITQAFDVACANAPCVVIFDDLDLLAPNVFAADDSVGFNSSQMHDINPAEIDQSKLITDLFRDLMRKRKSGIHVIATASSTKSLSQQILRGGEFLYQISVPDLKGNERDILYQNFLRRLSVFDENAWSCGSNFFRRTIGLTPRDLEHVAFQANNLISTQTESLSLCQATYEVLRSYVPLSRLASDTEGKSDQIMKLSEMGGLHQVKATLISTIVKPLLYKRVYNKTQIRLPRGILLFGFPGTGKSLCVQALAKEYGYPLISCRGPELLDKYIGASEAKVRMLFARAAAASPSILFLDELDALAPRRGSDNTGVTDRIVNQLLTFLDGVENVPSSKNGPVYVVCATSRPDKVDPALLRPGRLEKHIYFGLSDDINEVNDLVSKIAAGYSIDPILRDAIESGDFIRKVSLSNHKFRYFSAADISSMFRSAQLLAVHRALDLNCTDNVAVICYDNLMDAMTTTRPSITDNDYDWLLDVYNTYRLDTVVSSNKIPPIQSTALR